MFKKMFLLFFLITAPACIVAQSPIASDESFLAVTAVVSNTLESMTMGDSLTKGASGAGDIPGGYRNYLQQYLANAGYTVHLHGGTNTNPSSALSSTGQINHNGYGSWVSQDLINNLSANVPSINGGEPSNGYFLTGGGSATDYGCRSYLFLLIGTNDYLNNQPLSTNIQTLLTNINTICPAMHVFLGTVPPPNYACYPPQNNPLQFRPRLQTYNDYILSSSFSSSFPFVTVVDLYSLFHNDDGTGATGPTGRDDGTTKTWLISGDCLHPTDLGYQTIGGAWAAAIIFYLKGDITDTTVPSGYRMTFNDEFSSLNTISDSTTFDGSKWYTHITQCCLGPLTDPGAATSMNGKGDNPNPFSILPTGGLNIRLQNLTGNAWTSGIITSVDNQGIGFSQTYGYFAMKAKFPLGLGIWPAFWMLNQPLKAGTSPNSAEIDIDESYGVDMSKMNMTLHDYTGGSVPNIPQASGANQTVGYHIYGMLWDSAHMTFYLDNVQVAQVVTPAVMKQPYYLIADLGIGGGWPTDSTPAVNNMQIAYIRAYAPPIPGQPSASATTYNNTQASSPNWTGCATITCAGGANNGTWSQAFAQSPTVSSTGSHQFTATGQNVNALNYNNLTPIEPTAKVYHKVTFTENLFIPSNAIGRFYALEQDPGVFDGTFKYFCSIQADDVTKHWRLWDTANDAWYQFPSGPVFPQYITAQPAYFHNVQLKCSYDFSAHTYTYIDLTVDGLPVFTALNKTFNALAFTTSTPVYNTEHQIDLNNSTLNTNPVSIYYDQSSLVWSN